MNLPFSAPSILRPRTLRARMVMRLLPVAVVALVVLAAVAILRSSSDQKTAAYSDLTHRTQVSAGRWQAEVANAFGYAHAGAAAMAGALAAGHGASLGLLQGMAGGDPSFPFAALEVPLRSPKAQVEDAVDANGHITAYPLRYGQIAAGVQAMIAHPRDMVLEPLMVSGSVTDDFLVPVTVAGRTIGSLEVAGSLNQLIGSLSAERLYASGYVMAISHAGMLLTSPERKLDGKTTLAALAAQHHIAGLATVARQAALGRSGQVETTDPFTGQSVVMSFAPVGTTGWTIISSVPQSEVLAAANSLRTTLILVSLAVLIALCLAVAFITGRLAEPIAAVTAAAERVAEGDVEIELHATSDDEVGRLTTAFGRMVEYLREKAAAAERIAAGDLSVSVTPRSERDLLGHAFARLLTDLRVLVGRVSASAQGVSNASRQVATSSEEAGRVSSEVAHAVADVAGGAERQVQMVDAVRETAQEVARAIEESARNATETAQAAAEARQAAREGVEAAEQASAAMRSVTDSSHAVTAAIAELATKSAKIGAIVETITGIAEQTNLLALNAAIEAARAGEQGRGFAVVAEEVRKLAEESQRAAEEIAGLIQAMQGETQNAVTVVEHGAGQTADGVDTVQRTRDAFLRIGGSVDDVSSRIEQIAAAAQQVAAGANAVQQHIAEVAAVAEQSSASTEEVSASTESTQASVHQIASSAQELASTASELEELVGQFRLAD
jgi:methyl-accepting chemotaxis protein